MGIISYAQNFEDVLLWRALGHIERGCYIDIGAHDPIVDSVSKAFYERGWRGIHVEPLPVYCNALRLDRPDEIVLQAAAAAETGMLRFFEIPDSGISTGDEKIAKSHQERGFQINELTVPCVTLEQIFQLLTSNTVHWLKIDVEGLEEQVLQGWGNSAVRPWIVVVESTTPMTQNEVFAAWEGLLTDKGYRCVHFDGLNRYYLSANHQDLAHVFASGPNVFDGFQLSGTANSPFCGHVEQRITAKCHAEIELLRNENALLLRAEMDYSASLDRERMLSQKLKEDLQAERVANLQNQNAAKGLVLQLEQRSQEEVKALLRQHALNAQIKAEELERLRAQGRSDELALIQEHAMNLREAHQAAADVHGRLRQEFANREQALLEELSQTRLQLSAQVDRSRRELQELHAQYRTQQLIHGEQQERLSLQFALQEQQLVAAQQAQTSAMQTRIDQIQRALDEAVADCLQRERILVETGKTEAREYQSRIEELHAKQSGAELRYQQQLAVAREIEETLRKRLSQKALAAASLANELARLQQTISWRITSPLRRLATWMGGSSPSVPNQLGVLMESNEDSFFAMPTDSNLESPAPLMEQPATSGRQIYLEHSEIDMKPINHVTELFQFQGSAFVDACYHALLGRKPDVDGMKYYLGRLRSGRGKAQVLVQFAKSGESKAFKPKIQGLDELIVEFERENHWLWGFLNLGRHGERQINLLELQLGQLGEEIRQMRGELLGRMQRLESGLHQAQDPLPGGSATAVPPIQESESVEVMPVLGANGSRHFKRIKQALGHQK